MGGLNSPNPYSDGMNGGGDFWSQLSATNAELDALQEKIRSVSQAHQQILVSAKRAALPGCGAQFLRGRGCFRVPPIVVVSPCDIRVPMAAAGVRTVPALDNAAS